MGLGTSKSHILGRDQKFFATIETTPGQWIKAATASSMKVLTSSFSPKLNRKDRLDAYRSHRDVTERITGKDEYSWSLEAFYVPSGTKNTPPDCGDLIKCCMGAETVNANDVTYSLTTTQAITTLSLYRHFASLLAEGLSGAWVEEMTLSFAGGSEPKIKFSGGAMDYAASGYTVTNGALGGSETAVPVAAGGGVNFHNPASTSIYAYSQIAVGSSTDHSVTATATDTLTVTPAIVGAQNSGVAVVPYAPTYTVAGSPIAGISGSLTWDSLVIPVTNFELTLKNGFKPCNDHAFVPHTDEVIVGQREITGKFSARLRQDQIIKLLAREKFAAKALAVTAGGIAQTGTRIELALGYCELEYGDISVPEAEEATVDFTFKALASSGNDCMTLKHT